MCLVALLFGSFAVAAMADGPSRFVKVEFVDAEASTDADGNAVYVIGDETVPAAEFERTHFKISEDTSGEIDEATVDRFVTNMETTQAGNRTAVSVASTQIGVDVVKTANCAQTYAFDLEQASKTSEARARAIVWENLGFVHQWAQNGLSKDAAKVKAKCPCLGDGTVCPCGKDCPCPAVAPAAPSLEDEVSDRIERLEKLVEAIADHEETVARINATLRRDEQLVGYTDPVSGRFMPAHKGCN